MLRSSTDVKLVSLVVRDIAQQDGWKTQGCRIRKKCPARMWIPCLGDIYFVIQPFCCVRSLLLHRERQTDVCQNENCSWGACLWNIQIRPRHRCLRYCVISNSADDSVYFGVWIRLRVLVLNMRIGKIFDLQSFVDVENKKLVVQSKDNYMIRCVYDTKPSNIAGMDKKK